MNESAEPLLRAILMTTGRAAWPTTLVYDIVCPTRNAKRQRDAFNLADGTRSQSEIAKRLRIDPGQFSRTVRRWTEAGILFRLGTGRAAKLLHVYPLPAKRPKGDRA
jgi:hypothetical protein